jgi:hypothetical protein
LDTIKWRTLKPIFEWSESMFQVVALAKAGSDSAMMVVTDTSKRFMVLSFGV